MSPGNPAIEALHKIPIALGTHAHSIIPTLLDGPLETRDDGVVEYKSAHIDGVESELVIEHSGHSTQGKSAGPQGWRSPPAGRPQHRVRR